MKNEEIINRIKVLIRDLGISQNEFATKIEINPSNLSKHLTGRLPIHNSLLNKIAVNLGVSRQWLRDGDENINLSQPHTIPTLSATESIIEPSKGTPVYDVDVTAGGNLRSAAFTQEHLIGAINIPSISKECSIVRVSGDSMSPVIMNGDFIAIREVSNKSQIFWGQIYVIVLEDYRMVKYILKHNDPEKAILRSENNAYDDMEIYLNDIQNLMIVNNIIHIDSRL